MKGLNPKHEILNTKARQILNENNHIHIGKRVSFERGKQIPNTNFQNIRISEIFRLTLYASSFGLRPSAYCLHVHWFLLLGSWFLKSSV